MDSTKRLGILLAWVAATLAVTPPAHAGDGEGTAAIVSPDSLVAGTPSRVVLEVEIGPSGIPVGGGLTLGLHHAAQWPGLQCDAPDQPNHIAARCDTPDNLELTWHGWAPKEFYASVGQTGFSDSMCHQLAAATVKRAPLEPGERVAFIIGANEHLAIVQRSADPGHEFHIMTDVDGDGVFKGIAHQPRLDIVAGPAHHLAAFVPATVVVGEPFEMQLRAEDEHYNPADTFSGRVTVRDRSGAVVMEDVELGHGMTRITVTANEPGPQRYRLESEGMSGRSNPCRVFETPPPFRVYWGDIHGHTSISDGLGENASDYFAFGRDVADLDVCALTDHGHFDWPQTVDAVRSFYEPGRYVTLLAQEAGAGPDHLNIYHRHDDTPHIDGWTRQYDRFFEMVYAQYNRERPTVAVGPHHFTYDRGDDRYPFGLFDTRTARFVEVYSSHGTSEYPGNPRPCHGARDQRKFMQWGLAQGLRFGVIASSDNHDSHPGRSIWGHYPGGLVAFLAPELTREAIWDALWNYRTYAAGFDRIYLEFTVDGHPMGSDVPVSDTCRIQYYAIGRTDHVTTTLIRNNAELRVATASDGVIDVSFDDTPPPGRSFYYLRVVQDNGERAWSTPIWVTRR